jgi:hypothetical protein
VAEKVLGETEVARKLAGSPSPRRRNAMDRFIDGIELVAAFFVGIVAADIFISVPLRYFLPYRSLMRTTSDGFCSAS